MLIVSRREDESILLGLADGADGTVTLNELFAQGPIEIKAFGISGRRLSLGVTAPKELSIQRDED